MNRNLSIFTITSAILVASLSQGCTTVKPNPADSTAPKVELKVKDNNGQWITQSAVSISDESLNVECIVSDPEGVRSISLDFSGATSDSCTVGSTVFNGSFHLSLPAPQTQDLQGNAQGEVLTVLPLFANVGPFTCTVPGQQPPNGRPIGHVVTATCTGKNWSSSAQHQSAQAKLKITVH
jgi:hypothetical protein